MTIPSKEEFDEFTILLNDFNAEEIKGKATNVVFEYNSVLKFYRDIVDIYREKRVAIDNSIVKHWLKNDYPYMRGLESIFGKNMALRSLDEQIQADITTASKRAEWVMETYQDIDNDEFLTLSMGKDELTGIHMTKDDYFVMDVDEYNRARFINRLKQDAKVKIGAWQREFTSALKSYHYEDYHEPHPGKYSLTELSKLLHAMETLNDLIPDKHEKLFSLSSTLKLDIPEIKKELEMKMAFTPPIKKNDATIKERAFSYQLWLILEAIGYSSKTVTATTWFLQMEGIINQLDMRTVQRNLSKWKKEREAYIGKVKKIQSQYNKIEYEDMTYYE